MLKGIPAVLSPELLKILMEMGHGDELVIVDGNFPSGAHPEKTVRIDGVGVCAVLRAVLRFFPLDGYVDRPVALMALHPGETYKPEIWEDFKLLLEEAEPGLAARIEMIPRMDFYPCAKAAYAMVTTGETARYANIVLKKGVVAGEE